MDLKDLYRDVIVDHNRHPRNFGRLDPADAHADGFNPLCGDRLTMYVNLDGELVFPVANVLKERHLPFIFSTGYGRVGLPEAFKDYEVLSKPFTVEELKQKLGIPADTLIGRQRAA